MMQATKAAAEYTPSSRTEDDCAICHYVRQTREPTDEETESIESYYAGDFECTLHGGQVAPTGWCNRFKYFED